MSILSKETIETANSKDSADSRPSSAAQPVAGQLHSDAVSLEVPLKVHGSKVTEMVRGVPPQTEPFEEQTSSMIVFPHGGVLRMSTTVNAGQMLVLTNLKTRQDAICRVVKVRNYSNSASYVEVEFTHRQPGYWGVYFDSEPAEASSSAGSSAPAAGSSANDAKGVSKASSTPVGQADNGDSSFIHFGSHEEVQPAASSTNAAVLPSARNARPAASPVTSKKTADASALAGKASPSPVAPRSIASGANTSQADSAASSASVTSAKSIETLPSGDKESEASSGSALKSSESRAAVRLAGETLGSRLGSSSGVEQNPAGGPNWLLIAACGAGLLLAVGGGTVLFHHKSASASAPPAPPIVSQAPVTQAPVAPPPTPVTVTPSPSKSAPVAARETSVAPTPKPPKEAPVVRESPAAEAPTQPEPSAAAPAPAPAPRTSVPSVFGTLNTHPVAPTRQVAAAAPNVEVPMAPSIPGNSLLGITSSAPGNSLPEPTINANIPVPVGGRVKEPALLTRVLPQYPPVARQSHTQGDVAVQIVVDKAGNVVDARAISGPPVLRQAAIDAVRRWKYEPSTLEGQAISVQMLVTLRFQL
jgi:protein TonB